MEIKVLTPDLLLRIYNFPFFRPVCIFYGSIPFFEGKGEMGEKGSL